MATKQESFIPGDRIPNRALLRLRLLRSTLLGTLLLLRGIARGLALCSLVLHVLVVNVKSLLNLGAQSGLIVKPNDELANATLSGNENNDMTYSPRSSALSISNSMPVILPANSGCWAWTFGYRASPSICFC